jgi:hypothetical protein
MSRPGGVLTLDLSSTVGFAYGHAGEVPAFGHWRLCEDPDIGHRLVCHENELARAIEEFRPALVSMERALPANLQGNAYTGELQIGLSGSTRSTCYRWAVPLRAPTVDTIRLNVVGHRLKKAEAKPAIVAWCRSRGWFVRNDHEADACAVWAYETGIRAPKGPRARHVGPVIPLGESASSVT